MASIPQKSLFSWKEIEVLGDLERLGLLLRWIPDEPLMRVLESERGKGRNDYPVRAVWNSLLAGVVYQHVSIESLRRELLRNAQLREECGFNPLLGARAVPPPYVYTRFLRGLFGHAERIDGMFDELVESLRMELPEFGRCLAGDGKAIPTHARAGRKEDEEKARSRDGRRDLDADWGQKTTREKRDDGTLYEKVTKWFGYKLHLVVDAEYELPVAYEVRKASASEFPVIPEQVKKLSKRHPGLLKSTEAFIYDKGGDDTKIITALWDDHRIKPVIAIRNCWQDGEETRLVPGTKNVVYDYEGKVYCYCPRALAARKSGEADTKREMAYGGFEQDRMTLRYRCPARQYGHACLGASACAAKTGVRIPLDLDRRVFTPMARSSYAWERTYKKRTAVERVNSRLDVSYGFERHFIRGLVKMRVRCGLALVVMLATALGRVKEKQADLARSLVRAA
jgi:hypothetical protein